MAAFAAIPAEDAGGDILNGVRIDAALAARLADGAGLCGCAR
jgi:hypothetical protein